MASSTCEALVAKNVDGKYQFVKGSIPLPKPEPHQALLRVSRVAQNPTDVQSLDNNPYGDGAVLGCDFAGTVESVGSSVTRIAVGDTVAGFIWGGEIKGLGGFSTHTLVDESICFKVPKGTSLEEAATVPLAAATSWLALFSKDCLAIDRNTAAGQTVLIWGGSSSVGLYAVQIASLCGLDVVTTCSPRHADLVKSYGAKAVFDYHDEDVAEQIKATAPNLRYVFDTIGNSTSSVTASKTIDESGGGLCTVRPQKRFTENVTKQTKVTPVLVWTVFLKDHDAVGIKWPASQADHDLGTELFDKLPELLQSGKIKPNKPKLMKGLDAVNDGFQEHRDGKISAYKIVYEL